MSFLEVCWEANEEWKFLINRLLALMPGLFSYLFVTLSIGYTSYSVDKVTSFSVLIMLLFLFKLINLTDFILFAKRNKRFLVFYLILDYFIFGFTW